MSIEAELRRRRGRPAHLVLLDERVESSGGPVEIIRKHAEKRMQTRRERDDDEGECEECTRLDELLEDAARAERGIRVQGPGLSCVDAHPAQFRSTWRF